MAFYYLLSSLDILPFYYSTVFELPPEVNNEILDGSAVDNEDVITIIAVPVGMNCMNMLTTISLNRVKVHNST